MQVARVRGWVRGWPGVTEDVKWEHDAVFSVAAKMFCVLPVGGGAVSFKVDDDAFLAMTDRPGVIPAPYMARAKWVQVAPGAMGDAELEAAIRRSYELVRARLPKGVQKTLAD